MSDPTVIPPDCLGIIISPNGDMQVCVPKFEPHEEMPDAFLAPTYVITKIMSDPAYEEEMRLAFEAEVEAMHELDSLQSSKH